MRKLLIMIVLMLCPIAPSLGQVSISVGINVPVYPQLVRVPGYPVYYAPQLDANYFFYDGVYWLYDGDNWYASTWYNGPWSLVAPDLVPLYVLRVPVRYYRRPPVYFRAWRADAPPHWGEHWGGDWERNHRNWDHWNRNAVPAPAPLPYYQRGYAGDRYPHGQQQFQIQDRSYTYRPRDEVVRQNFHAQRPPEQRAPGRESDQRRRSAEQTNVQSGGNEAGMRPNTPQPPAPQPRARSERAPQQPAAASQHQGAPPPQQQGARPPQHQGAPAPQQQGARPPQHQGAPAPQQHPGNAKGGGEAHGQGKPPRPPPADSGQKRPEQRGNAGEGHGGPERPQ